MTDHLTAAILAASRLDDTEAVAHLATLLGATGYGARKLLREFPITLPALLADRPSLRAAVEHEAGVEADRESVAATRRINGDVSAREIADTLRDTPRSIAPDNDRRAWFLIGALSGFVGRHDANEAWFNAEIAVVHRGQSQWSPPDWNSLPSEKVAEVFEHAANSLGLFSAAPAAPDTTYSPKAGHAVALAIRAQSEARPFDTLARIEAMGYPHLADLARRAWSKLPAGSFAFDEAPDVAASYDANRSPVEAT